MPTYEYRCNGCQREFEIQQRMSDDDLVHCDVCGQDKLEKLISWTSVRGSSHHDALFSANPREAMKGTAAVDRSRPPKKEAPAADAATTAPAGTEAAAPTTTEAAAPSAEANESAAVPVPMASAAQSVAEEDDDQEEKA